MPAPRIARSLLDEVEALGGVVRTGRLADAGHSARAIAHAVSVGALQRVRNGWVASPGADSDLVNAARHRVVLTCVTGARRLGLWTLTDPEVRHVGVDPNATRMGAVPAHVHWAAPLLARHPDSLVDPVENVLVLTASCLPREEALVIWESAFRQRLVDPLELARYALPTAAQRMLAEADIYSDSGLETLVVPRLRWLRLPLSRQVWIAGHPVDLLIGERLVLQIDGGHHVGAQRTADIAHDARLALLGYHVIRVGYDQVVNRWHEVHEMIIRVVAQGLHLAR